MLAFPLFVVFSTIAGINGQVSRHDIDRLVYYEDKFIRTLDRIVDDITASLQSGSQNVTDSEYSRYYMNPRNASTPKPDIDDTNIDNIVKSRSNSNRGRSNRSRGRSNRNRGRSNSNRDGSSSDSEDPNMVLDAVKVAGKIKKLGEDINRNIGTDSPKGPKGRSIYSHNHVSSVVSPYGAAVVSRPVYTGVHTTGVYGPYQTQLYSVSNRGNIDSNAANANYRNGARRNNADDY